VLVMSRAAGTNGRSSAEAGRNCQLVRRTEHGAITGGCQSRLQLARASALRLLTWTGGRTAMKGSRRSPPTRTSSKRLFKTARSDALARTIPSTATKRTTRRIADKMQRLALRRPHMLHLVEHMLDGMLSDKRREDARAKIDD